MTEQFQFERIANFRDVGQTINSYLGQKRVRQGVLFRSARPDDASARDVVLMRDELGIRTIIDLRTQTELLKQAEAVRARTGDKRTTSWFSPNPQLPRISGVDYQEIKITGRSFERHLLRQLAWWTFIKVMVLFIFGYRLHAIKLIAVEAMLPRGLLGLATDTIDHSGAEINRALKLYTSQDSSPILVHCTQGKDRTGLIIILVLMILNIPLDAIEHDYRLTDSDAALCAERHVRIAEAGQIGLNDEWARTCPELISGLAKHLDDNYAGPDAYLDGIGFDTDQRSRLRQLLLY